MSLIINKQKQGKLYLGGRLIKGAYLNGVLVYKLTSSEVIRNLKIVGVKLLENDGSTYKTYYITDYEKTNNRLSRLSSTNYYTIPASLHSVLKIEVVYTYLTRGSETHTETAEADIVINTLNNTYTYYNSLLKVFNSLDTNLVDAANKLFSFSIFLCTDKYGKVKSYASSNSSEGDLLVNLNNYTFWFNRVANTRSLTKTDISYKSGIVVKVGSTLSVVCGGGNNTNKVSGIGSSAQNNIYYATALKRQENTYTYTSGSTKKEVPYDGSSVSSYSTEGLTVTSNSTWCTLGNSSNNLIPISISANAEAVRTATLTFSKTGYTLDSLYIEQAANPNYVPPVRYDNLTITSVIPSGKVNASGTNSISSGTVYYSYNDNNGNPKTGSETINFTAVTGNNLGTTVTPEKAIATRQISLTKGEHTATGTVTVYLVKNDIYSTTLRINASSTSVSAGANSITLSGTLVDTYDSTKTKETTVSPTYSITSGSSYGSISNSTLSVFSRTTTYGASTRLIKVKGTYSNMTSNELTITQAANTYEDTWNNPSVSISCNIPATGGNVVSYASIDVTLKGTRTFSSGSTQSITNNNTDDDYWDSATYTWNGSVITSKTILERKIASVNNNVGTLGVTVKIKGKSASASCTVTLSAAVTSAYTYGNVTIGTFTVGNVPVSGGVPTTSITITLSYSYKINNTQYSGTYDEYDLEYSLTYKNTSGTVVSTYGKAALNTTANKVGTVTLNVTGEGNKTATKTIDVYQTANSYTTSESAGTFELTPKTSSINYASNTIQLALVRTYTTYKDWATGDKTITSTSNVEFIKSGTASVVNGGNWCTTTTMSGNYYRYSVSANDYTTTRSCTLRVTYKGNNYDSSLSQSGSTYSTEYSDPVIETFSAGNIPIKGGVTLLSVVTYKVTYNLISKKNGSVVSTTPLTHSNTNNLMGMSWTASVSGNISSNAKNTSTRTAGTISCKFTIGSKSVTSSTLTITLLADSVKSDVNTNKTWTATLLSTAGYNGSGDVTKTNAVSANDTTVFIRLRESYTRTVTWTSGEKDVTTVSDKLIPFSSFKTGLSTATSWLTIEASNSNNEAAIIGVAKNTTTNSRTGIVSVNYGGSTKTVSIEQEKGSSGGGGGTTETKPTINSVATSTSGWWLAPVATGGYAGGGTVQIPVNHIALFKNATETTNKTYLYSGNIVYSEVNAGTLTTSQKTKTVSGSINPSTNLVTINNKSYPGINIVFGVVGAGIVSTTIKIT